MAGQEHLRDTLEQIAGSETTWTAISYEQVGVVLPDALSHMKGSTLYASPLSGPNGNPTYALFVDRALGGKELVELMSAKMNVNPSGRSELMNDAIRDWGRFLDPNNPFYKKFYRDHADSPYFGDGIRRFIEQEVRTTIDFFNQAFDRIGLERAVQKTRIYSWETLAEECSTTSLATNYNKEAIRRGLYPISEAQKRRYSHSAFRNAIVIGGKQIELPPDLREANTIVLAAIKALPEKEQRKALRMATHLPIRAIKEDNIAIGDMKEAQGFEDNEPKSVHYEFKDPLHPENLTIRVGTQEAQVNSDGVSYTEPIAQQRVPLVIWETNQEGQRHFYDRARIQELLKTDGTFDQANPLFGILFLANLSPSQMRGRARLHPEKSGRTSNLQFMQYAQMGGYYLSKVIQQQIFKELEDFFNNVEGLVVKI